MCSGIFLTACLAKRRPRLSKARRSSDIQFPNGQPLDPADLARALPLRIGQPLHSIDVAYAIDGLFATGRFEDIVVEAEPAGEGVIVRFVTRTAGSWAGSRWKARCWSRPIEPRWTTRRSLRWAPRSMTTMSPKQWTASSDCCKLTDFMRRRVTPTVERGRRRSRSFLPFASRKATAPNMIRRSSRA